MTGSMRPRLRSEISRGHSFDDPNEGTSARTRPFSYEEVMSRRKTKELEILREEARGVEQSGCEETAKNIDHDSRDATPAAGVVSRHHEGEAGSRKTEEKSYKVQDLHSKSKNKGSHDVESRSKHKHEKDKKTSTEALKADRQGYVSDKMNVESLDLHSQSMHKNDRDLRNITESSKTSRRSHISGKLDEDSRSKHQPEKNVRKIAEASKNDGRRHASGRKDAATHDMKARSKYKYEKDVQNSNVALKPDRRGHVRGKQVEESSDVQGRSKHKHDKDVSDTDGLKNDRRGHLRSNQNDRLRDGGKYDHENKHHRALVTQDRNLERSGGATEREKKRKDRIGDDEKDGVKDPVKKRDGGRRPDSVISERKEKMELSRPHISESRSKRRRSRSQDRSKDNGRRSRSASPEVQKNSLSHEHGSGQLPLNSHRDRLRHHSDVDRSKMSGNGSTNHNRRHNGSSSGLGGYSPRKRKTEAAVKTPSPIHSPERKNAGWDLPTYGSDVNLGASSSSGSHLVSQSIPSNMIELATSSSVASSFGKPLSTIFLQNLPAFKDTSVDSVQLTQATRPMRRLYIDNIPSSASEKDIMECFNNFLLSSGSNYIRGTRPCISCMIHKEKGQALLEFLTPEDASSALSFNGRSFYGCALKIRRPKDYVDMASGSAERLKAVTGGNSTMNNVTALQVVKDVAISDVVKDSPNKIFVGGIAEGLSSEMIMEIVSVFGPLKAFHFDISKDLNEPCAFLEYADHSITLKACAGLNGMKLGGKILTVAQAVPKALSEENSESPPFYGIPEHVRQLFETPTQVLKLSNVLTQKVMESLPDVEVEEILEDVRLECSRFGAVVSVNVVKYSNMLAAISEAKEVDDQISSPPHGERELHGPHLHSDATEVAMDHDKVGGGEVTSFTTVVSVEGERRDLSTATANCNVEVAAVEMKTVGELVDTNTSMLQICEVQPDANGDSIVDNTAKLNDCDAKNQEPVKEIAVSSVMDVNGDVVQSGNDVTYHSADLRPMDKAVEKLQEGSISINHGSEKAEATEDDASISGNTFEVGCVLVEFRRTEAACMAAHCLHGRSFCDRIVSVEYVPLESYRARFPK